jgi:hypothetical protein
VSIQAAINGATAGDEVRICSGNYAISNTVIVNRNIILGGEGERLPVLDGGRTTRIMSISSAWTVTIKELLFQNGMLNETNEDGAALQAHPSSNLTVIDSLFVNNVAKWHGGAISMNYRNNQNAGSLNVLRSTFYRNRAEDGGAINMFGIPAKSSIRDSTFVSNVATRSGGAISGFNTNVTAFNSTFVDNTTGNADYADTSWDVSMIGNIIASSPAVTSLAKACGVEKTYTDNVSTHASCLSGDQEVVTYDSLGLKFLGTWGARVPTMPIDATSSAINAVTNTDTDTTKCAGSDQFGAIRTSPCDAGATEHRAELPTISTDLPAVALVKELTTTATNNFTHTGLTNPVQYRITTELNPLDGVTMSSTGTFSGAPKSAYTDRHLLITGTDVNGLVATGQINVGNGRINPGSECTLSLRDDKYVIATVNHLDVFRLGLCGLDKQYEQIADIGWNDTWSGATTPDSPFTGTYDGGGHSVTGLSIYDGDTSFIAYTDGATISRLTFEANVTTSNMSGGLVHLAKSTSIDNVQGSGSLVAQRSISGGCRGGLIGKAEGSTIQNSSYAGNIEASNDWEVGGLVGCAHTATTIERSHFNGTVNGYGDVGGLVGWLSHSKIGDSFAIGSITGSEYLGGLVGYMDGSDPNVIGVQNSYASTEIAVKPYSGTLFGWADSPSFASTFWEAGLPGVSELNPIGFLYDQQAEMPNLKSLSATEMKDDSLFADAGWSIGKGWSDATARSTVWAMCDEEDRPFLFWQYSSTKCEQFTTPTPEPDTSPADTPTPPSGDTAPTPEPDTSPAETPAPPSSDPAPTTDTTSPSTTTPTSSKADSVSATDANSTTSSTVVSPTTPSSTQSVASTVAVEPKLAAGGVAIFQGGTRINNSLKWSGTSTISGMIGNVKFSVKFNQGVMKLNIPAVVKPGSSFNLSLQGLKPGSQVVATLFSQPTTLGTFLASTTGTITSKVKIPETLIDGPHRLRVDIVDQNNRAIAVWTGIRVLSDISVLPATGRSSLPTMFNALWVLLAGLTLTTTKRTASTLRRVHTEK